MDKKKIKRYLIQLCILAVLVGTGYYLWKDQFEWRIESPKPTSTFEKSDSFSGYGPNAKVNFYGDGRVEVYENGKLVGTQWPKPPKQ